MNLKRKKNKKEINSCPCSSLDLEVLPKRQQLVVALELNKKLTDSGRPHGRIIAGLVAQRSESWSVNPVTRGACCYW